MVNIVCVGSVRNFLPRYEIVWSEANDPLYYCASIRDYRASSIWKEFLDAVLLSPTESASPSPPSHESICDQLPQKCVSNLTVFSSSRSLSRELKTIVTPYIKRGVLNANELSVTELPSPSETSFLNTGVYTFHEDSWNLPAAVAFFHHTFGGKKSGRTAYSLKFVPQVSLYCTTLSDACLDALDIVHAEDRPVFSPPAARGVGRQEGNERRHASMASGFTIRLAPSLLSHIGRTGCALGKRRLQSVIITHPLTDVARIRLRQEIVAVFSRRKGLLDRIQRGLIAKIMDLDKFTFKIHLATKMKGTSQKKILASSLLDLLLTIETITDLANILGTDEAWRKVGQPVIAELKRLVGVIGKLQVLVEEVYDVDSLQACSRLEVGDSIIINPKIVPDVADSFSELKRVQRDMEALKNSIASKICGSSSQKLRFVTHPQLGKVLRAPRSVDVPSKYQMLKVNKNERIFTTAALKELIQIDKDCKVRILAAERAYIAKTIEVLDTYMLPFCQIADLLGTLDVLASFAGFLQLIPNFAHKWTPPIVFSTSATQETGAPPSKQEGCAATIHGGRHAILDLQCEYKGLDPIVANDFNLGGDKRNIMLITGPNMGGKSTYSRQQALIFFLAQIGSFVPAAPSTIVPVVSVIALRIGASDNPFKGASTFMTEAIETAQMLAMIDDRHPRHLRALYPANPRSNAPPTSEERCASARTAVPALLVIDELGRGTCAMDGLSFAFGVLHYLKSKTNVLSIFATHFHELAVMASETLPEVVCMCLSKSDTGAASFHVKEGIEPDSDAIKLAEAFHYPPKIIEDARHFVQEYEKEVVGTPDLLHEMATT